MRHATMTWLKKQGNRLNSTKAKPEDSVINPIRMQSLSFCISFAVRL